mmetsp:Transcript_34700/g.61030  ORF Transcript_34700/g.61030 Transcript_34700/m.61030 type:complete len:232 (+) Transcript_34700:995-1690(+)
MFVKDSLREVKQAEFEVMLRFRKLKRNDEDFRQKLTKVRIKHTKPLLRTKLDLLKLERKPKDSDTPRSTDTEKMIPPPRKKEIKLDLSFFERTAPVPVPEPLPYEQYIDRLLRTGTCRPVDAEQAVKKLEKLKKRYPGALKLLEKRRKKFAYDVGKPPLLDSTAKHRCSFSLYETFYAPPPPLKDPNEPKVCCVKYREQKAKIRDSNIERYFRPKTHSCSTAHKTSYSLSL